jgi:hypothetical protein
MEVTIQIRPYIIFNADVEDPNDIKEEEIDGAAFGEAIYYQLMKANPLDLEYEVIEIEGKEV